ncbi:hypothetical protein ES702_03059 [subsurface metagenome]
MVDTEMFLLSVEVLDLGLDFLDSCLVLLEELGCVHGGRIPGGRCMIQE